MVCPCFPGSHLYMDVVESFYDKSGKEDLAALLEVGCMKRRKVKLETKDSIRALTKFVCTLNEEMKTWISSNEAFYSQYENSCKLYSNDPDSLHPPQLKKKEKIPEERFSSIDNKLLNLFKKTIGAYGYYYTQAELSLRTNADKPLQTVSRFFRERPKHRAKKKALIRPLESSYRNCQDILASVKQLEAHIQDIEYSHEEMWQLDHLLQDFIDKFERRKTVASINRKKLIESLTSPHNPIPESSLEKLLIDTRYVSNSLFFFPPTLLMGN
ncbi:MAG: hypothetical protein ACI9S8_002694 [Chlamydiales bacterium]|jgi:hypothetical protein